jgi:hypothetical protein
MLPSAACPHPSPAHLPPLRNTAMAIARPTLQDVWGSHGTGRRCQSETTLRVPVLAHHRWLGGAAACRSVCSLQGQPVLLSPAFLVVLLPPQRGCCIHNGAAAGCYVAG